MKTRTLAVISLLSVCLIGYAQQPTDDSQLVRRIKERLRIPPAFKVTLGPPKPAELDGLVKRQMEVANGKDKRRQVIYLSVDGRYVFAGRVLDLSAPSLEERLSKVSTENHPTIGAQDAKVTIVEYADYQCPYCERAYWVVKYKVLKRYGDKVRLVFKDFPLKNIHPWATQAAIAGQCAFQQGNQAFWKMHDFLFEYQDELNAANLQTRVLEHAETLGIDAKRFEECLSSAEPRERIDQSVAEARELGLTGTPAFVVGGELLRGAAPFTAFRAAIEKTLKAQQDRGNASTKK